MKYFDIVLLICHPDLAPELITQELDLKPFKCIKSIKRGNRWNYVWSFKKNEKIMVELPKIVNYISSNKSFLKQIVSDGGDIQLIINLPGLINHGLVINNNVLVDIVDMGMNLGFEVFPDWENESIPDDKPNLKIVT